MQKRKNPIPLTAKNKPPLCFFANDLPRQAGIRGVESTNRGGRKRQVRARPKARFVASSGLVRTLYIPSLFPPPPSPAGRPATGAAGLTKQADPCRRRPGRVLRSGRPRPSRRRVCDGFRRRSLLSPHSSRSRDETKSPYSSSSNRTVSCRFSAMAALSESRW